AFAERRILCPSTSTTSPGSMKCAWPLCRPSPLSRFASLMRPLATPSTVPTWTPSAPITSMFRAILSVVIWSLLVVSSIALELHVLRQAEARDLPTHVRREEIAVARAEVSRRPHAMPPRKTNCLDMNLPLCKVENLKAVSGRPNVATGRRCERLRGGGEDPWQTVHDTHAV